MCIMQQYVGILHLVLSMFLNLYVPTIAISYTVFLRTYCVLAILWALHSIQLCMHKGIYTIYIVRSYSMYMIYNMHCICTIHRLFGFCLGICIICII